MSDQLPIPGITFEGELGRGAHSVVYRGRHNDALCAIKLPRTRARWSRWIYREAVALARVKHPLLPAVLEVGEVDGLPFLVMELVEGVTLAESMASGRLEVEAVVALGQQLASVLGAVHDAGLVHRDVKPRNIVVRPNGALKLVDFGFATPMERVGSGDTSGTAAYSAPEQLAPPGSVDGRADLYAVGRVLFEALWGQSLSGRTEGPWGLAARDELVAAGIASPIAEVVAGLLGRTPADRYSNARALKLDLDRVAAAQAPLGPARQERAPFAVHLAARQVELEGVIGACSDARAGGGLVILRAPRGGGKTRLLEAVQAQWTKLGEPLLVSCRRDDAPLALLRRVLDAYWREHLSGASVETLKDLREGITNFASVVQLIAPEPMMLALGLPARAVNDSDVVGLVGESLAEGAAALILRLASSRAGGTVVAIDDAQWMDPVSADTLLRVAHRVGESRLALLLAMRSESSVERVDAFAAVRRAAVIDLPVLTETQVGRIVAYHLGEATADRALVERVHSLAGGTPLGVLEVLGAFLDAGVLRPHARTWLFDANRTEALVLPTGALVLLGRRIRELPEATRRVLEVAAIVGRTFDEALVASVVGVSTEDLGFALAGARRAGILEPDGDGHHRFAHDSLRETVVDDLALAERRRLHQAVGDVLASNPHPSFEELCATAHHFAAGDPEKDPERNYRVARAAGEAALGRFDNETALRFLSQARRAADLAKIKLDARFFQNEGEAHLRLGTLDESLVAFESALGLAPDAHSRAVVLGRLSWVHQMQAQPERAWATLDQAFSEMHVRMPIEDLASAATTSTHLARWKLGGLFSLADRSRRSGSGRPSIDLLCELHYQNARLGLEYGKPARLLQSGLESRKLSERGSERVRARAHAFYALAVTALGRREAGAREVAQAKSIAAAHGDTATMAFCVQLESTASSWAGDLDRALVLLRECVDVYGPWLELSEYCGNVSTADIIQSIRGRADESWIWIERAIERLRRSRAKKSVDFILHRARVSLAANGRRTADDPWLTAQLAAVGPADAGEGFHRLMSWGPRARYFLEADSLGAEFEELVASYEREGYNPKSVHLAAAEYYIAVAHARIHQWLRASVVERALQVSRVRSAALDLRGIAKIPLFKAHSVWADAALAWVEGKAQKAQKLLSDAETLANQQSSPWVLYGVARIRAHMLRSEAKEEAARDQARVAELLAREHGAVVRARWVREEFGLPDPAVDVAARSHSSRSSSRTNRQLSALLQVARAPRRDLRTEQQAGAILDELMNSLQADLGSIWFQPEPTVQGIAVSRQRGSEVSVSFGGDSPRGALLREVHRSGMAWPSSNLDSRSSMDSGYFDPRRLLAVPLFLYEKPVGALSLERSEAGRAFTPDDRSLLMLLSHQVPIALEIARLLFEREQLQTSLQQAKKMEAMGQLAGGLAHDFNNMLSAMKNSLSVARERASEDAELATELDVISQATTRASQLTGQLLSFSRHKPVPVATHEVNQLVVRLEPMLRRIVGTNIKVESNLSPAVDGVEVDDGSFDQALVNLAINARDAMATGGTLVISTKSVALDDAQAQRLNIVRGEYVELQIADTGHGMSPDTMARVFEPFFTTKAIGSGTGLGLAMVYAFARNCGGAVDVASEVGRGTQFKIYLRRAEWTPVTRSRRSASSPPKSLPPDDVSGTILLVDDDDLVRSSTARVLERHGYRVLATSGAVEALSVARQHGDRIGLVILDMLMPGVTGPELGRRLRDENLSAKLLFVSGFSPESIPIDASDVASDMLLTKPFSHTTLLERVRQLMTS